MTPALQDAAGDPGHPLRPVGWIVSILAIVLLVHWQTAVSMVDIWRTSQTYSHGIVVLPAFLWLVWDRRLALSGLAIRPAWLGLFGLAAARLLWLVGNLAAASAPSQVAGVAMVPGGGFTVFGGALGRRLALS